MDDDEINSIFNKISKTLPPDVWEPATPYRYTVRVSATYRAVPSKLPFEQRQPAVDEILDYKQNILRLVTEIPGVEKQDVDVNINCGMVQIFAKGRNKRYNFKIPLKYPVCEDSPKISLRNGVLEIIFRLKQNHT